MTTSRRSFLSGASAAALALAIGPKALTVTKELYGQSALADALAAVREWEGPNMHASLKVVRVPFATRWDQLSVIYLDHGRP